MSGAVAAHHILHFLLQCLLVLLIFHVNEINHDNSSKVAEAKLPSDFFRGFHVHLQSVGLLSAVHGRTVTTVYINYMQCLCLFKDDVTTVWHVNSFTER